MMDSEARCGPGTQAWTRLGGHGPGPGAWARTLAQQFIQVPLAVHWHGAELVLHQLHSTYCGSLEWYKSIQKVDLLSCPSGGRIADHVD
eukprot:277527-Rhodomonas_salina.1